MPPSKFVVSIEIRSCRYRGIVVKSKYEWYWLLCGLLVSAIIIGSQSVGNSGKRGVVGFHSPGPIQNSSQTDRGGTGQILFVS